MAASPTSPCTAITSMAPGSNCSVIVAFKGCYDGTAPTATVNVLAPNAANGNQSIPVVFAQGVGQCPAGISLSPATVTFTPCPTNSSGVQDCSLPPDPVVVTVTDTGSGTLHITNVKATIIPLRTSVGASFTATPDASCDTVPPGGQCTISVAFQLGRFPADPQSGTMVVDSNAIQGEQSVPLSWPGFNIIG